MSNDFLKIFLEISQQMLETGAEIYRIEDSLRRMCHAYGCIRADVYATSSNIIVSVELEDESIITQTRKVGTIGTDIARFDRLNSLVRKICAEKPSLDEIKTELISVDLVPKYPFWWAVPVYGIVAMSFCLFFGGRTVGEYILSFVIGCLSGFFSKVAEKQSLNKLLDKLICSFVAAALAFFAYRFAIIPTVDNVIIGNIMTLIPGIGLTNSLRDLFKGDLVTGILRSIEAILLALSIALGFVIASLLFGGVAV